ncbi:heavy-metal-associated domain-containing protein [Tessaracoccus oleiagri]|uniref:Copper ion binding protein n=1 Tax=Tessaracoccus oleiagri TaxID=686624 RepID=A0A1G9H9D7_9ACTN|nr:cation transporter [Tessaracoccus oleiagri]SDL09529.1 copper ion binding protein [Tessaracoccus oleiagri]
MESKYIVTGMTCGHCVKSVTEEVSEIEGVNDVQVTLDGGQMVVTSEAPVAFESIEEAVKEAGNYTVAAA